MRTKKMKHEKKKKKKIWNDFSFNLPVQLQEGNSSNRFSIMERRLTGSKGEGSLWNTKREIRK